MCLTDSNCCSYNPHTFWAQITSKASLHYTFVFLFGGDKLVYGILNYALLYQEGTELFGDFHFSALLTSSKYIINTS